MAVNFCPKQSGWLINQLGNPSLAENNELNSANSEFSKHETKNRLLGADIYCKKPTSNKTIQH
jgi:hypothetical protein